MKTMVWTLEDGRELRVENEGNELVITVPDSEITVREMTPRVMLASMPDYAEFGAKLVLEIKES